MTDIVVTQSRSDSRIPLLNADPIEKLISLSQPSHWQPYQPRFRINGLVSVRAGGGHLDAGRPLFFFCVGCDGRTKSSGRWLLGSPLSAVVGQLAPRAWCLLQCLLAKTVGVLSPGVGRSEECVQEFAPQSHIHSGLNQQDLISSDVFFVHSDQYADRRWWYGSSSAGC